MDKARRPKKYCVQSNQFKSIMPSSPEDQIYEVIVFGTPREYLKLFRYQKPIINGRKSND